MTSIGSSTPAMRADVGGGGGGHNSSSPSYDDDDGPRMYI